MGLLELGFYFSFLFLSKFDYILHSSNEHYKYICNRKQCICLILDRSNILKTNDDEEKMVTQQDHIRKEATICEKLNSFFSWWGWGWWRWWSWSWSWWWMVDVEEPQHNKKRDPSLFSFMCLCVCARTGSDNDGSVLFFLRFLSKQHFFFSFSLVFSFIYLLFVRLLVG